MDLKESESDKEPAEAKRRAAIRRAQALVRLYIPEGRSLSDELIQERRGENRS
jgi:hypothetical protein